MKKKRRILIALSLFFAAFAVVGGFLLWEAADRPEISNFSEYFEKPARSEAKVRVTFLGTSTLLIEDGETAIMTDGFFSRPSRATVVADNLRPNIEVIDAALKKFNVTKLATVIPVHTHHDHAMDSPIVAMKTGATLVGSESAAKLGRGYGMDEKNIRAVEDGDTVTFGKFKVTFILSKHAPPGRLDGNIHWDVRPPVRVWHYKSGDCFSLLFEHEGRKFLVHASAGFIPDFLKNYQAETVYLGVGLLGKQDDTYRLDYWREVVQATGARNLTLIHWDNFFRPFDEPLRLQSYATDDFTVSLDFLKAAAAKDNVRIRIPVFGQAADPFSGTE